MASAARRHSPIPHEPSGSEVSEAEEEPLGSEEAEEESGGESGGGGSSAGAAASEGEEPEESDSDETTASDASVRGSDIVSTLSADVARGAWAGEPAEQAAAAAAAGSAEPPPRPESRESEGSEVDFTRASSGLGPAARGREPPPPSLQEIEASPFIDLAHPVTLYEGAKLLLMAPLVLFKLLLLGVAIPYAWAVLWLLLLGHRPQTPMAPFRQFLVRQWVHQWGRFLLFLSGFYFIRVRGLEHMRAAEACRAIIVFNHPSYVDAAVIATFFTPSGVSKAGVARIPFIGLFGRALQLFFIERKGMGDRANRHVLKGDAVDAIAGRAADRRFPLVAIAPEATTKACPCLLRFRRGAFAAGQPVAPVLLRYRYRHFNPGWGVCFTPFHVYRLLAQARRPRFVNHLEIEVLPPVHPTEAERADWGLFAENVRRLMAARLGVLLVEQGIAEERQLWRMGVTVNLRGTRVVMPRQRKPKGE